MKKQRMIELKQSSIFEKSKDSKYQLAQKLAQHVHREKRLSQSSGTVARTSIEIIVKNKNLSPTTKMNGNNDSTKHLKSQQKNIDHQNPMNHSTTIVNDHISVEANVKPDILQQTISLVNYAATNSSSDDEG